MDGQYNPPQQQTQPATQPQATAQAVTSQTTQTAPTSPTKSSKNKIIVLVVLILMIAVGVYYVMSRFSNQANTPPTTVSTPTQVPVSTESFNKPSYTPEGFAEKGDVQVSTSPNGETYFALEYVNERGNKYSFQQVGNSLEDNLFCTGPGSEDAAIMGNYTDFNPQNSEAGCASTAGLGTPNVLRSYRWIVGDARYVIYAFQDSITDEQALQIANSVQY